MTHDEHMICLQHKSGLFLEVLKKNKTKPLTELEKARLDTITLHLYYEKDTEYKVVLSDVVLESGRCQAGVTKEITIRSTQFSACVFPPDPKMTAEQRLHFDEKLWKAQNRSTGTICFIALYMIVV